MLLGSGGSLPLTASGFVDCDWTLFLRGRAVFHVTAHRYRVLRGDCGSEERIFEASNLLG